MATKPKTGEPPRERGRPPKAGIRTSFILSPQGRAILEEVARKNGSASMAPMLEMILRDYAARNSIEPAPKPDEKKD